jgi:NAD-dependent SIR2 family protein deacetylase
MLVGFPKTIKRILKMKIIKTLNHIIMVAETTLPKYACIGKCKKVWWENDMHISASILKVPTCPACGGKLKLATKLDYEVIN